MEIYPHAKVIISILVSFALTHLLRELARVVEHPKSLQLYWVHLVWVVFAFLYVISFWWWEYWLEKLPSWNFPLYLFVTLYGVFLYFFCALLMPNDLTGYKGFRDYFYSRRRWLFGVMAAIYVFDWIDSLIKAQQLPMLGSYYGIVLVFLVGSIIAIKTQNERFHAAFAVMGTLYQGLHLLWYFTVRR